MQLLTLICTLSLVCVGGGVTGVTKSPGSSDFWTDDYKIFEQVFGKTSDRHLYSDTLPITYTNLDKFPRTEASEKKRHIDNHAFTDFDPYSIGDRYAKLFAKQILNNEDKPSNLPKLFNFVSLTNFKPITQLNDPETYNYLKHLEKYNKGEKATFPKEISDFKPYATESEESQVYESIQDILDAHEANKRGEKDNDNDETDEQMKYLTYGNGKGRDKSRKKPGDEPSKPRCWSGRCRKRAATNVRIRKRPYVRKITQNRWIKG